MNLIDSFRDFYGQDCINNIFIYMQDNEIVEEFEKIKDKPIDLFIFSVKYGIIEIVQFMYEKLDIEYDHSLILGFDSVLTTSTNTDSHIAAPIVTDSRNDKCSVQVWDKFSKDRNICIAYLVKMMRYSKHRSANKKFYYKFNKKYQNMPYLL